jgi:hypothetical protein
VFTREQYYGGIRIQETARFGQVWNSFDVEVIEIESTIEKKNGLRYSEIFHDMGK